MVGKATFKVLSAFLENPARELYGFGLMRSTGVKPGSLYPILDRLEGCGWLSSADEEIDEVAAGRPKRRHYRLTALGEREATKTVEEFVRDLGPIRRWLPEMGQA
jgi:DNA-binding PadR family transcriptional regulator